MVASQERLNGPNKHLLVNGLSWLLAIILVGGLLSINSTTVFAQATATASISGVVRDPSGGVVPAVQVILTNPATGLTRRFTTQSAGQYSFTLVPPGTYDLSAQKTGFRAYVQKGITLVVGQSATQDITLQLGQVSQRVTVTAQAPILERNNANVASTVTQRAVVQLPLNQRNVFGLVAIDSSVNNSAQTQGLNPAQTVQTADQDISFFNFGGQRFGTTAYLLDGTWDGAGDWDG
ncbi:MAG: carboxypeptidase-like regulatory domain-containing protein, partial [Acidobacteriota bacterium]